MIPSQFRLENVTVQLIERLEGTRRSFAGRPEEAAEAFRRLGSDTARTVAKESREYLPGDPFPDQLVGEVESTLVPRYTRLAVAMTEAEESGFGLWRGGDWIARLGMTLGAALLAVALSRVAPGIGKDLVWIPVPAVLLLPEILGIAARYRYGRALQSVVEDMARIQKHLDEYPRVGLGTPDPAERHEEPGNTTPLGTVASRQRTPQSS